MNIVLKRHNYIGTYLAQITDLRVQQMAEGDNIMGYFDSIVSNSITKTVKETTMFHRYYQIVALLFPSPGTPKPQKHKFGTYTWHNVCVNGDE
ncbi:hypothetical protein QTP88_008332 [Uroleucon formosanum]